MDNEPPACIFEVGNKEFSRSGLRAVKTIVPLK